MNYSIKEIKTEETSDGKVFWACCYLNDTYHEVPFKEVPSEEEVKTVLQNLEFDPYFVPVYEKGIEYLYCNGAVVRTDEFDSMKCFSSPQEAYREPYFGSVISKYYWETPSDELLKLWNVSEKNNLFPWYGIKEINGKEEYIKIFVEKADWAYAPSVPGRLRGYGSLYDTNGNQLDDREIIISCHKDEVRKFCVDAGLVYPIPDSEKKHPWCYSFVWSVATGDIKNVKGYVRHPYD
jgi:hypothetical protein